MLDATGWAEANFLWGDRVYKKINIFDIFTPINPKNMGDLGIPPAPWQDIEM